jgi:tetratricopeptide (TPR) repeat protein
MDKSNDSGGRLAEKIKIPASKLMLLLPILGLASLVALGTVVVLGVTMLESLVRRAESRPEFLEELTDKMVVLSENINKLELEQKTLSERIDKVTRLANELYLSRPLTELEEEKFKLSQLSPSKLLERGMADLNREDGRPVLFFEIILQTYPDSPETVKAMLQLGALRVRIGDYKGAEDILSRYLDRPEEVPAYDTAWANYYLGMAQSDMNRNEEAVAHYRIALGGFPESDIFRATIRFNLGEIYMRLGEKEKAAVQFEALLKEFCDDKRVAAMLKRAGERLRTLKDN